MTELNLSALASSVLHDSLSPDPAVMADTFVAAIPAKHYREALTILAADYLRQTIRQQRNNRNGGEPNRTGSRKVANARDAWKRLLDTPEFVPGTGWLFLRDATVDQVLQMAGLRRTKAQELNSSAGRYDALASEMERTKAVRVGDLPEESLVRLLGESEAVA